MKICIDLTSLADNFSGIERYAAQISLELIKSYDEQFVLIFKNSVHSLFREYAEKKNIEIVIIYGGNKLIFNQIQLPWAIHKIKADWYLFMAFPVPMLSLKKNMVSTIHDICCWDCPETMNGLSKWYFRISHRVAIRKCRAIITISEFSKNRIHEKLKYPDEKIWVIYCGINKETFTINENNNRNVRIKYGLPDEYILSLSTLEPRKNIQLLIRAYDKLLQSNAKIPKLVLAGRKGWKMDEFLASLNQELRDNLIFTGFIDDEDLPNVYSMANYFVFPSMYEGFGMPPLEAIACGTRVLSSDASSLPEVLGTAADYFESENEQSLLDGLMKSIIYSDKLCTVQQDPTDKFSWNVEAKKLYLKLSK